MSDIPKRKIVIASRNEHKIREMNEILVGLDIELVSLLDFPHLSQIEETGGSFEENARCKAAAAARATGLWAISDDSGIEVDALGGAPGVLSSRFAGPEASDEDNNKKLLDMLKGVEYNSRGAGYRCVVALADAERVLLTAEGSVKGVILSAPRGSRGFGYDPLFYYPPFGKTFAEVAAARKHEVSHRGKALRSLRRKLERLLSSRDKGPGSYSAYEEDRCKGGV